MSGLDSLSDRLEDPLEEPLDKRPRLPVPREPLAGADSQGGLPDSYFAPCDDWEPLEDRSPSLETSGRPTSPKLGGPGL